MGRAEEGAALGLLLFLWRVAVSPAAVASRAAGRAGCVYTKRESSSRFACVRLEPCIGRC